MAQFADVHGSSSIQGAGLQVNLFGGLNDEVVGRLLPEIERLLAGLSEIVVLIHDAAGAAQVPLGLDLAGYLAWLAELMTPAEQLPRPLQVSELARYRTSDPAAREALGVVGERWAAQAPDGQRLLGEFRETVQSSKGLSEHSCLLIVLDNDRNGSSRYWLSLILFRNGRDGEPQSGDGRCMSLAEIQNRLRDVLPALVQTIDRRRLILEFAVPRELLSLDFDQWLIPERAAEPSARKYRLGSRFPVVVRDLERMVPPDDRSLWRARWQRLRECAGPGRDAVRWVDPRDRHSYDSLTASLLREHAHGQVCLALLPTSVFGTSLSDLLCAGLTAGVPAAIWLRQPCAGGNGSRKNRKYLTQAVMSAELRGLPHRVLDLRQEAEAKQQKDVHPSRHLSLLWDDPDRTWRPPPFAEPALSSNGTDE